MRDDKKLLKIIKNYCLLLIDKNYLVDNNRRITES